jgi:hypothetical protein
MTTTTPVQTTARQHPARRYLSSIPEVLHTVRDELVDAVHYSLELWPFVWRATLQADVERAHSDGFKLGLDWAQLQPDASGRPCAPMQS